MHILSLGLNHISAPVYLRERLAFDEEQIRIALSRYVCGHLTTSLSELIVLSTCNRIEIYAASNDLAYAELEAFLSDARGVPASELRPYLYRFRDGEAGRIGEREQHDHRDRRIEIYEDEQREAAGRIAAKGAHHRVTARRSRMTAR